MTTKILFMCPHNAAKSVTAAAYMSREATERGLDVAIDTAGTDPDPEVLPLVRERLTSEGFSVKSTPRLVTNLDLATNDIIINIGCPAKGFPLDKVTSWLIPNFSEDPAVAFKELANHVAALASSLQSG